MEKLNLKLEHKVSEASTPADHENQILYFMIMKDSLPLVEVNFLIEGTSYDSVLLSGFISAINSFAQNLTKNEVKVIDQGNIKIALEKGSQVSVIYMVNKVTAEIQSKVQTILNVFESQYEALLKRPVFDISLFESFQSFIGESFAVETIKPYYIPKFVTKIQELDNSTDLVPQDIILLLSKINGKKTVSEIVKSVKKDYHEVLKHLAWLRSKKLIEFEIKIDPFDVPLLNYKGSQALIKTSIEWHTLKSQFGDNISEILKAINGKNTIQELITSSSMDNTIGLSLFKTLISKDYIRFLPEVLTLCLMLEHLYRFLSEVLVKNFGHKGKDLIENSLRETKNEYMDLITFDSNGTLSFEVLQIHLSGKKGIESDKLYQMFLSPFPSIFQKLKTKFGDNYVTKIKRSLNEAMQEKLNVNHLEKIQALV